ncbi:serine/threonine-protein phosphatase 6 regulatory ankyrin repeat subunit A-like [Haliotis rubra]|uniref:serine/threonine-protein phosphatase 6 regulatory ankyrin repeat subunit A-like n=1 Tax=Haliotis rubra TaxID=36100 RepID=UPI001EE57EFC|nr:serine/threonine-protein phosphatase 6 regulatory ankyrin repeat subunit A-like [Haliotis rubra]
MDARPPDLHDACRDGNEAEVQSILSRDSVGIDRRGPNAKTPVLIAAERGVKPIYDLLINRGCDISKTDDNNNNILHAACKGGNVDIVEDVISRDAALLNRGGHHRKTPVMLAVEHCHEVVFHLLLDNGCDPKTADALGYTVLHWACLGGSPSIVKHLLSQGNIDINVKGTDGVTPVMAAGRNGHEQVFDMLVEQGCDLSIVDGHSNTVLHHASRGGCLAIVEFILTQDVVAINKRGKNGLSPVMIAAEKGHKDIFYLLINKECDLKGVSKLGNNILHCAACGGCVEVVEYLLSRRTVDINSKGCGGITPVLMAALMNQHEVFLLLVNTGCDLTVTDANNDNVLHQACRGGATSIIEYVLSQDIADINGKGRNRLTPVMIAAEKAHKDIFYLLLSKGSDLSGKSVYGDYILHCASIGGNVEIIEYLLSQGVDDINSKGQLGATPVMMAAQKVRREAFGLLVSRGSDPAVVDENNDSLLHHACSGGCVDIVEYVMSVSRIDINRRGQHGLTPIMMAAYKGNSLAFHALAEVQCDMSLKSDSNLNIFHIACISGNVEIVEYLMSNGADMHLEGGEHDRTPISMAAMRGHRVVFDLLVKEGCCITDVDADSNNILHHAVIGGNKEIVEYLLANEIFDINSPGQFLRTPVMMAAENGRKPVFELLVKKGCDLTLVDESGNNILHAACCGGNLDIVEYVLSRDLLDINARGAGGNPIEVAETNGYKDVVDLLKRKGGKAHRCVIS